MSFALIRIVEHENGLFHSKANTLRNFFCFYTIVSSIVSDFKDLKFYVSTNKIRGL